MTRSLSRRVALYLALLATGLLTLALTVIGYGAWRASTDLGAQLTQSFVEVRTFDETDALLRSGSYLSNRLFNPLYNLDVSLLNEEIEQIRSWLPVTDFLILDARRRVVTDGTPENRRYGQAVAIPPTVAPGSPVARTADNGTTLYFSIGFGEEIIGHAVIGLSDAASQRSMAELHAHSARLWTRLGTSLAYTAALALALVALVSFVLSWWLSRVLSRPLAEMTSAAQEFAAGNLERVLAVRSRDEVGELARSLNQMAADLKKSGELLARSQEIASLGSWEWLADADGLHLSAGACRVLGLGNQELRVPLARVLALVAAPDQDRLRAVFSGKPGPRGRCEVTLRRPDGVMRVIHLVGEPAGTQTAAGRNVGTLQDVTERREYEQRLRYLANYDVLTGLPNRNLFRERLRQAMRQADRHGGQVALLFLDLDRFKAINDALGHVVGDELLEAVAHRLREIAGEEDRVARLGGDEFTVILADPGSAEQAAAVSERLLGAIARPFQLAGRELVVSGSIGVTLYPRDARDLTALLRNADAAMYLAKEQGRNTYRFFTAELDRKAHARLSLEHSLRRAIARREFELHYQPQVRLADARMIGAEALLRWRSPEGLVQPGLFVPALEETGLITELTPWVLAQACAFAGACRSDGLDGFRVAVNLSARQFQEARLLPLVARVLSASGLPPEALEIEITESTLLDHDQSLHNAEGLTGLGVRLSLDDFGTGYSSLAYLKRYAVDCLKVDRSFIRDILVERDDALITGAVVALAKRLDMEVIAEGVETVAQLAVLRDLGCDHVQGHLFSPALAPEELRRWAQARTLVRVA